MPSAVHAHVSRVETWPEDFNLQHESSIKKAKLIALAHEPVFVYRLIVVSTFEEIVQGLIHVEPPAAQDVQ